MKEKEIERLTKLKEIERDLYNKGFKNICEYGIMNYSVK